MTDSRFSAPGKPATAFEHELLRLADSLEDPWVEVAGIVGLDATLLIMDRFERCLLSCPQRQAFIGRLHRTWLDMETLRLRRLRVPPKQVAEKLGIRPRSIRRRVVRALRRTPRRY